MIQTPKESSELRGRAYWLCYERCIQLNSYYITDTLLSEEAILGENNPTSTAATGLRVGVSATGNNIFNTERFTHNMHIKFL